MRLVLPVGPDGADREYSLDGIADLSRLTLNETIDLKRMTNVDLNGMVRGFRMLDKLIGIPNDSVLQAMSAHLELMEAYRALVWLARYRAGDRGADGNLLTVEAAVDFPFNGLVVRFDPGDEVPAKKDPRKPPTAGSRATGGGKAKTSRGRSAKTSAKKS